MPKDFYGKERTMLKQHNLSFLGEKKISKVPTLRFIPGGSPEELLEKTRKYGLWRPTAVALVRYGDKYCLTRHITKEETPLGDSRKRKVKPDIPKGGVDPGETVLQALKRELREEIRLCWSFVLSYKFLGYALIPFDKNNRGRDGYKKGKLFLIYEVVISRPAVSPGRDHRVISIVWRSDPWNHFRQKNGKTVQKRELLMQPALRSLLLNDRCKKVRRRPRKGRRLWYWHALFFMRIFSLMQLIPIKTRRFEPPKDDLFTILDEYLSDFKEGDILMISSKIVAIGEGRCVLPDEADKNDLVKEEEDFSIPRPYWRSPLSSVHHAFIGAAGIDESNAGGYLVLLPEDPFLSAKNIYQYLKKRFGLNNTGVIIVDSRSEPMRYGAMGTSIGFWGIEPLHNCIGEKDLFGREMKVERSNLVDGLAAAATVVMGEVAECTPLVIARNVPSIEFVDGNRKDELFAPYREDTFRVLYEDYLPEDLD